MLTQRHAARIVRESWNSAFSRGMHNPGRLVRFDEARKGTPFRCVHRWFISAGDSDDVDTIYDTNARALYVISRNIRYGYCGIERFDIDAEDDAPALSLFAQSDPSETFGRNWEDAHPRTIVRRIAEYE